MPQRSMASSSLRTIISVSTPLMLASATETIMLFADRAFLAHHSVSAMNAASATFMMTSVFVFFAIAIAGIAEVLAGQYNGEKRFTLVGRPIWQMLWFCLGLFFLFIPLGIWGKSWLLPASLIEEASGYFTIICFSAPLWSMQVVLAGFFATTGRSKWLTPIALIANILNIIMDYFLIFGFASIPALGATGAALATVIAQSIQVLVLFWLFLRPSERETYGTGKISWHPAEIKQGIQVGLPNAVSHGVEISAWAFLYRLAGDISTAHLTVLSTVTSINMLFGFLNEGLKQGIVAIASNLIGAGKFEDIRQLLRSGIKLQTIIAALTLIPMVFGSSYVISFMGEIGRDLSLQHDLKVGLFCMWLFIVFDGLVWVLNGILTAGGDTKVTMLINIAAAWLIAVLPNWVLIQQEGTQPWVILFFVASYAGINLILHAIRYRQSKWQQKLTSNS